MAYTPIGTVRVKQITPEDIEDFQRSCEAVSRAAAKLGEAWLRVGEVITLVLRPAVYEMERLHAAKQERPTTVCDDCLSFVDVDLVYKSVKQPGRLICQTCFEGAEMAGRAKLVLVIEKVKCRSLSSS
jgi:hypothetical protein